MATSQSNKLSWSSTTSKREEVYPVVKTIVGAK
jgi:hypothetical protein